MSELTREQVEGILACANNCGDCAVSKACESSPAEWATALLAAWDALEVSQQAEKSFCNQLEDVEDALEAERKVSDAACAEVATHSDYDAATIRQQYTEVAIPANLKPLGIEKMPYA